MAHKKFSTPAVVKITPAAPASDRPAVGGSHGQKNPSVKTYHGTGENPETTGTGPIAPLQDSTPQESGSE